MNTHPDGPLMVSSKSAVGGLAGAIAAILRRTGKVELQAVGASSVNQAVKAIAVAGRFMAPEQVVCFAPTFNSSAVSRVDEQTVTAIRFKVESHPAQEEPHA